MLSKTILILFLLLPVSLLAASNYYFNTTSGSDAGTGTIGSPWATRVKFNGLVLNGDDTVFFNGGDRFQGPFYMTSSGTLGHQIVITSYGTGNAILEGFEDLSGHFTTVSGSIMQATCITCQPTIRIVKWYGKNTPTARTPDYNTTDGGYWKTTATTTTTLTSASIPAGTAFVGAHLCNRRDEFTLNNDSIIGQTAGQFTIAGESSPPLVGFGFFVQGIPGCINLSGEWAWINSTRNLQIQVDSTPTAAHAVEVSAVDTVIIWTGNYTTLRNITVEGANKFDLAFTGRNQSHDSIINCNIRFAGINAIELSAIDTTSLYQCGIINTDVYSANNNGLSVIYPAQYNNGKIDSSRFRNIALIPGAGASGGATNGGVQFFGLYDSITRCVFDSIGGPGWAQYGGDTSVFQYDIFSHCGQVTADVGGIYFSVHSGVLNTIDHCIASNILGNYFGTDQVKPIYGNGFYFDNKATNVLLKNSTTYGNSSHGIFLHMSRLVRVDSCVSFGNSQDGMYLQESSDTAFNNTITNSQFIALANTFAFTWYANTYNNIARCFTGNNNNVYARPIKDDSTFRNNGGAQQKYTLADWKTLIGQEANSKGSPQQISDDAKMILFVNATLHDSTIVIPQGYVNVYGSTQTPGPKIFKPFTSLVLIPLPIYLYFMLNQ